MSEAAKEHPDRHERHRDDDRSDGRDGESEHVHVHVHIHNGQSAHSRRRGHEREPADHEDKKGDVGDSHERASDPSEARKSGGEGEKRNESKQEKKDENKGKKQDEGDEKDDARNKQKDESPPIDRKSPEARERMKKTGRIVLIAGVILVAVCALAVVGIWLGRRHSRNRDAAARSREADKGPIVLVARVTASPAQREVILTADVRSLFQTTLYAKVAGYVRDVRIDKGDHVKKGQILGTIESPETDQALVAAESANALRIKLADRARRLAPAVVPQQDLDTANSNQDVAKASLISAQAMQGYEVIRAPFDAVVTARYVDPGALMPAATGGTQSALPFVDLADPDTLRVDAYVGQDVALFVHLGDSLTIWQDARPGVQVHAWVTRTSGSLDPRSRTMLVEAQIDNRPYGILPGTFANVSLHLQAPSTPVVPAEALLTRDGRNLLAVVDGNHVHLVPVTVGLIDGKTVQIPTGIQAGPLVALNLPTEVNEGGAVQTKEQPTGANEPGGDKNGVQSGSPAPPPAQPPAGQPSSH